MRTRWSSTTSTHCVTCSTSRRSAASASELPIDQYAIAPISSSIGQQRTKKRRAISAPQRSAIASSGSKTRIVRSARLAKARTAVSSSPGRAHGPVGRGVDDLDRRRRAGGRRRRRARRARRPRPARRPRRARARTARPRRACALPRRRCRPRTGRPACGPGRRCRWLPGLVRSSLAGRSHRRRHGSAAAGSTAPHRHHSRFTGARRPWTHGDLTQAGAGARPRPPDVACSGDERAHSRHAAGPDRRRRGVDHRRRRDRAALRGLRHLRDRLGARSGLGDRRVPAGPDHPRRDAARPRRAGRRAAAARPARARAGDLPLGQGRHRGQDRRARARRRLRHEAVQPGRAGRARADRAAPHAGRRRARAALRRRRARRRHAPGAPRRASRSTSRRPSSASCASCCRIRAGC